MQKEGFKKQPRQARRLSGFLAHHAASIASAYCLYRVYAWGSVEYYPFGEAFLDTPPLPMAPNSCPFKFASSTSGLIPVQDAVHVPPNTAFVMLNGANEGMWVSWGDHDSTAKRDLSMCSQALASFGAKAFGNHGVDVDHATLYDQMGNALAGQPWDAVVTATRVHVLLDQEVWVWPGIHVGHEWSVDGARMKTLSLSPKAIFVTNFLTADECNRVVESGKDMLEPSPTVSKHNLKALERYRTSSTAFMGHLPFAQEVKTRGASLARLPARDYIEDIQLVRYEAGQMYKAHTDYFTHVDVADELNHPASKSFSHWIQWVQQLNVIPPSHPLYPTHTNEFELQLASLLLQPNSFVNDALWTYIPPEWKAWMEKHVALQSDYIISSMVAAFQPVNPVVPLSFIRQRWEEVVGVPAAVFRFPLLAKYIEPNRHATLFVYLNNVGDGGETVFPMHPGFDTPINTTSAQDMPECSRGLAVRPQQGSGVLFYSKHPSGENDYRSLHGGCPPAKGSIKWGSNLFMWNVPAERGQRLWKLW
ncbi:hypothetical protein H310_00747 [Aphanomyces invadans]|uniref:Prolyl 4-hydroxylase alpha subunit domain-containing protein n=1 Tax=Aphanomyces invadans TaxID=157072 RepID=A0A024UWZ0_9STRA|nr:hypothetical protein H310_00747 [Aphanomyces invadans]ETW10442.1 hypothetical protein H310_00747 [Aphanomyces invadans]|eukprot:XP_008861853.1 hypothetical protein H310_00747 [Aphanomyces invadans]